jgi:pimeloyl-ACP methyl ester carboxylesterase
MKKSHLLAGSSGGGVGSVPRGGAEDYAPVDWSLYFDVSRKIQIPNSDDVFRTFEIGTVAAPKPLVVLHHGGGHSALSWALCARALADLSKNSFSILAFDCRGHGRTKTSNDGDLSLQTLSQDMVNLIRTMYGDAIIPPIFLVGHSMGGAIVVHVASQKMLRVQGIFFRFFDVGWLNKPAILTPY